MILTSSRRAPDIPPESFHPQNPANSPQRESSSRPGQRQQGWNSERLFLSNFHGCVKGAPTAPQKARRRPLLCIRPEREASETDWAVVTS